MRNATLFASIAIAATMLSGPALPASLVSGKKLEVKVNPETLVEERAALWKKFGGWCAIADWHPAIAKCEESKDGDAVLRTLTLQDGGLIKERLLDTTELSYRYQILESPLPVKNYEAQFAIVPDDDDEDEINIQWSATYDPEGKPDKEARATIDGIFKDGLDKIKTMLPKPAGNDDDNGEAGEGKE